jgi:hypothetical protein
MHLTGLVGSSMASAAVSGCLALLTEAALGRGLRC